MAVYHDTYGGKDQCICIYQATVFTSDIQPYMFHTGNISIDMVTVSEMIKLSEYLKQI